MRLRSRALRALAPGLLLAAASAESQTVSRGVPGVETQRGVVIVAELAEREAAKAQQPAVPRAIPRGTHPGVQQLTPAMMRRAVVTDVVQPAAPHPGPGMAALGSPLPLNSFAALSDSNTAIPPDTHGAAGPVGLVVALNTDVGFQYRNGTFSRFAIMSLPSFWSTVCNTPFDPKVLYDHLAARWVFAAVCEAQAAGSSILIGSSFTNDAYGGWNTFRIDADAGNTYWADYPSIGYNKDWVAVSVNMFPNAGGAFHQTKIYVFKKADLYKSGAVATHTVLTANEGFTLVPAITHDASLATLYLVDQGWTNGTTDFVRISTITGDVGSEVLTEGVAYAGVTSTRWDNGQPGGDDFAPQQGSDNKIDAGDARVQNAFYRNGSLWFAHTIFLPQGGAARSAVQWWQVTPDGTVTQRGRVDDDDQDAPQMFYAYPSLAVNADDDMMIGFASFSADQYASGAYALRRSSDPAGTLRSAVSVQTGKATYFKTFGGNSNRWGDYSSTVVDPVNDTDFWTIQEYAEVPSAVPQTYPDRWGTWWVRVSPTGNADPVQRRWQVTSE